MARKPLRPLIRSGGFYPSRKWTPLVYAGGYTTANGGEEPAPPPIEKTVTGNPIHILDALAKPAQALSVKLEPVQDLHGYDNPWPGGGGKNKLQITEDTSSDGGITYTVQKNDVGEVIGIKAFGTATVKSIFRCNYNFPLDVNKEYYLYSGVTGDSFGTYAVQINLVPGEATLTTTRNGISSVIRPIDGQQYLVRIVVWQGQEVDLVFKPMLLESSVTDTSFAPYSNICPISGHTDADVTRTGKNLLDKSNLLSGLFPFPSQMRIAPIGAAGASVYCPIKGGETYTVSKMRSARFVIATTSELPAQNVTINNYWNVSSNTTETVTTAETDKYLVVFFYLASADTGLTQDEILNTVQVELGSTASDYAPFVGTTYPIPLGQTVYGGTLDVLTGVLTVTMVMVDLGTLTWSIDERYTNKQFYVSRSGVNVDGEILCSSYEPVAASWSGNEDGTIGFITGGTYLICVDNRYSTTDAFKTAVSGVQLVYTLATPQTIQLTPTQVELLQGENNIFSDGEMTLVYLADGNASDVEALNILLGGRYVNNHEADEPSDREALDILLGRTR